MTDIADWPDVPDALLWHYGMLLSPQHLQQQALANDRALRFRFATANRYAYGLVDFEIDQAALVSGLFRIVRCTAVMPDGLVVQIPPRDGQPLELDLTSYVDRLRVQPLRIELIVPREAAAGEAPNPDRFRDVSGEDELDTGGGGLATVPRRVPNAALRVAETPTHKFTSLPLAEVVLRDEAFALSAYTPPRLLMPEDQPLSRELSALTRRIREKAVYLSERARSHRARAANDAAEALRLPLNGLTASLPELEALLDSGNAHPFDLHLALGRMAGAMTVLSDFTVPPQGRGYRHDDIQESYRPLLQFLHHCLDQIRQEFTVVAFEPAEGGFRLDLKTLAPTRDLVVAAQVAPGRAPDATWSWLEDSLIAAPNRMDDLRRRRTLGAPRRLLEQSEAIAYTLAPDTVLATVSLDNVHVGPDDVIQIVNNAPEKGEARPVQLYAYVSTEAGGSERGVGS